MAITLPAGIAINAPIKPEYEAILTPEALDTLKHQRFMPTIWR